MIEKVYSIKNGYMGERIIPDYEPVQTPAQEVVESFTSEDIIETLADHEYRVCLLELGINEEEL